MEYTNEQIARCFAFYIGQKCVVDAAARYNIKNGTVGVNYSQFPAVFDAFNRSDNQFLGVTFSGESGLSWLDCFGKPARVYTEFLLPKDVRLVLKDLSSITDEDAVAVAKMCGLAHAQMSLRNRYGTSVRDDSYSLWISYAGHLSLRKNDKLDDTNMLLPYQFLIERGYNLPLNCLGGKTPIEAGLAIPETVNPSLK